MKREQILLDPTAEAAAECQPRIARPATLDGLTVALLDIAKPRGNEFLDRVASQLEGQRHRVRRYRKERFSKLAAPELLRQIASECDVAIEALAD